MGETSVSTEIAFSMNRRGFGNADSEDEPDKRNGYFHDEKERLVVSNKNE